MKSVDFRNDNNSIAFNMSEHITSQFNLSAIYYKLPPSLSCRKVVEAIPVDISMKY
jgi:hypothetical protein